MDYMDGWWSLYAYLETVHILALLFVDDSRSDDGALGVVLVSVPGAALGVVLVVAPIKLCCCIC